MTAGLFEYAGSRLGLLEVVGSETRDGIEIEEIRFDNGSGGSAAALVARPPEAEGVHAGVVVAHGGYEGGKHLFVNELVALAGRGIVGLAADTSLPRDPSVDEWEEAMGAAVRLQRRALDVLQERHGARPLGYFGHSAGGMHGASPGPRGRCSARRRRLGSLVSTRPSGSPGRPRPRSSSSTAGTTT